MRMFQVFPNALRKSIDILHEGLLGEVGGFGQEGAEGGTGGVRWSHSSKHGRDGNSRWGIFGPSFPCQPLSTLLCNLPRGRVLRMAFATILGMW